MNIKKYEELKNFFTENGVKGYLIILDFGDKTRIEVEKFAKADLYFRLAQIQKSLLDEKPIED